MKNNDARKRTWWKQAVVYQVYIRSFMDTDGDGVGDLPGVTAKLDYLKELGIDVIWLSPVCDSPNDDNGYDVRDYYDIMKEYGTMRDMEELLEKAHERGIKILLDLVVNHTSDENAWFMEAKKAKDSDKRDYYIWRDPKDGGPPNNWGSFFSPSAWAFDKASGQYYLHLFSVKQPDLNWECEAMRKEVYEMMTWWLEKGIDGFRMDVITGLKKPEGLPDSKLPPTNADGYSLDPDQYFNNDGLLDYYHEMNREVLSKYDLLTVGEASNSTAKQVAAYTSLKGDALSMTFHFDTVGLKDKFSVKRLRAVQQVWYDETWNKGWSTQYLSNHDQPRQVSIYGDDKQYCEKSAKLLAMMLHTLPGTPFVYQGEELGMTNIAMDSIDDYDDFNAHFDYSVMLGKGKTKAQALAWLNRNSRDNSRTPMQWDGSETAGFTTSTPWLKINPNNVDINAAQQIGDPKSVFSFYRNLIRLRRENPVMVYGDYVDVSPRGNKIYAYIRLEDGVKWLIVLNLSGKTVRYRSNLLSTAARAVISNYDEFDVSHGKITCPPWYSAIFAL